MFGAWKDTEQYIACSQWMQAEGLRYILEANRRRCFRNSGSIIWQLNEPWPNISCTSLLEYHGAAKMAYFWAKAAFRPVHPAFDYTRLDYAPGGLLSGGLAVLRDAPAAGESTLIAQIFDMAGTCLFEEVRSRTRVREGAEEFGALCWQVPESLRGLFLLRLTAHAAGRGACQHVLFQHGSRPAYRPALEAAPVLCGTARFSGGTADVEVGTQGARRRCMCLSDETDSFLLDMEENFFTLLPGGNEAAARRLQAEIPLRLRREHRRFRGVARAACGLPERRSDWAKLKKTEENTYDGRTYGAPEYFC